MRTFRYLDERGREIVVPLRDVMQWRPRIYRCAYRWYCKAGNGRRGEGLTPKQAYAMWSNFPLKERYV